MSIKNRHLGMSIAEILVACGLLAMALVTIMILFGQLIKSTNKNALMSAGSFFADGVIEREVNKAEQRVFDAGATYDNSVPLFPPTVYPLQGEGFLSLSADDPETRYLYSVNAERLDGGLRNANGQMWFLEVEVRWWQDDMSGQTKARAGMGNMNLKRGRMTYIAGGGRQTP